MSTSAGPISTAIAYGVAVDSPPQSPAPKRAAPSFTDLNALLGPKLREYRGDPDTFRAALAVTQLALARHNAPPRLVRAWLATRDDGRFASITATDRSFGRVLSRARTRIKSASSPAARRERQVGFAKVLVVRLLTPVHPRHGFTARRVVRTRHAFAIMGLEILRSMRDQGIPQSKRSQDWLAVRMGVSTGTAGQALKDCVRLGWLRPVGFARGGPQRFTLPRPTEAISDAAWDHSLTVDALVEWTTDADPVAAVIAAASHPALSHDKDDLGDGQAVTRRVLGPRAWLAALAMEAGIEPTTLGLGVRTVRGDRAQWLGVLSSAPEEATFGEALDLHARRTGADVRWRAAEEARIERAASHGDAYKAVGKLLVKYPLPKPDEEVDVREAWLDATTALTSAHPLPERLVADFERSLRKRLRGAGYDDKVAAGIAARIARQGGDTR